MSRPSRFFLPALLGVVALSFSACVGTIYDRTYSNKKTYFKPPKEKKDVSAEAILGQVDSSAPATPSADPTAAPADGAAPAAGGDIPGLTPVPAGVPGLPPP